MRYKHYFITIPFKLQEELDNFPKNLRKKDVRTMAHYRTDWKSLRAHPVVPEWLREGKFGIYTHWGPYSVPACRPNGSCTM